MSNYYITKNNVWQKVFMVKRLPLHKTFIILWSILVGAKTFNTKQKEIFYLYMVFFIFGVNKINRNKFIFFSSNCFKYITLN